jgi:selenocysteine lyase/cysteine desulfurase
VDAVQALGAIPIDADAADILAAGGQKWLRAGWVAALLLVRDRVADLLQPGLGGWSGVVDPLSGAPHPHPSLKGAIAHTVTNPDGTATAALGVAIDLVLDAGIANIGSMVRGNLAKLLETASSAGALVMDPAPEGGIGNFRIPGMDTAELHQHLARAGISATRRGGWIRISPHASTSGQTIEALTGALSSLPSNTSF